MAPGRKGRIIRRSITIGIVVALSLGMEVAGFVATPAAERPEVGYTTLHAIVPLVFAACAGVAWAIGPSRVPARLMVLFPVFWIPVPFLRVVEGLGWLWPLLYGVHLWWGVLTGVLVLLYPRGDLDGRLARWVAGIAFGASLVFLLGTVLLAQPPEEICSCAPNPYAVGEAPVLYAAIDIGYRLVGVLLALVIAARLLVRWVRGSVPARTVAFLMPLALFAWATTLAAQAVTYAASGTADQVLATVSLVAIASIPVSFVAGIAHTRNMRARVADLMRITREGADRGLWAESLARTLRDASVRVYWWDEERGRYADASGEPIVHDPADRHGDHGLLPVASPTGMPIALIRHDRVLTDNMRLLDGVSSALRLSVDNGRLRSEIERTLDQVRQSRARIVEAGDEARRRIERDLHDGAQQRLVSLGMRLRLAANQARDRGMEPLGVELDGNIAMLNDALKELRELAHGIHPSLLSSGGLALAVPELAGRCPVPVEIDVQAEGRLPEVVESTAYFAVAESLANIAKHAQATRAWVRAHLVDGVLEIVVRDNGVGGAAPDGGGMLGIADRVDAVGGDLAIDSPRGAGTTITIRIPVPSPAAG
ncbi:histidine kinase [Agromyces sp. H3Y2-19a]|jgi:signal transduction histidine kinase|uniref:sensor histidine kinase n=1 Tax=Agromyces TaxID=33877 RepID=UPI001E583106|nr:MULTISPECIES: histidine kinase [Agromyces]MCD5346341.1 histidine kinase [Agromyces sp. S2-1-8]MDF0512706.1 histidine kinase [Agromyces chromiiresistens]